MRSTTHPDLRPAGALQPATPRELATGTAIAVTALALAVLAARRKARTR